MKAEEFFEKFKYCLECHQPTKQVIYIFDTFLSWKDRHHSISKLYLSPIEISKNAVVVDLMVSCGSLNHDHVLHAIAQGKNSDINTPINKIEFYNPTYTIEYKEYKIWFDTDSKYCSLQMKNDKCYKTIYETNLDKIKKYLLLQ